MDKFTWNEENTATVIAAYQDAIASSGIDAANSDEALNQIAAAVGAKNANSIRRKLVIEKVYQKTEKPAAAKRETKAADPLAWDDEGTKFAQVKELYIAKKEKDGVLAANDTDWLTSIAARRILGARYVKVLATP